MALTSLSAEWGVDDCVSHALGDDFTRPDCIRAETQEKAYIRAVRKYGDVDSMVAEFARLGAYMRVCGGDWEVGDVIVGSTVDESFCIAKIGDDYLPVARTLYGYAVVEFVNINSVWRKEV